MACALMDILTLDVSGYGKVVSELTCVFAFSKNN